MVRLGHDDGYFSAEVMKILIITKSFVREVNEFITYLKKTDAHCDISVIVPHTTIMPSQFPASIHRRRLWFSWHIRAACFSPRILQDIRRIQPDILHIFEEISGIIAFQSVLFRNLCGLNSRMFVYSAENIPGNVHPLFRVPMRYVMRHVEQAFVCSVSVETTLRQEGFCKPITVFPLGVDTNRFCKFDASALKAQLGLDGKFVLGYCGRLLESKGILLLADMMPHLPEEIHLLMIGSGAEQLFRRRVAEHGVAHRVHLAGNIEYENLPSYLNCMNLGIVPSQTTPRWKEQFGRSIIELMSCEIPVIGSDSGSIPEIVGEAGAIFPEHDIHACLAQIRRFFSSPEACIRSGLAGRKRVLESYSAEVMSKMLFDGYKKEGCR
ncbi:glycosyl transferase group 1 [Candidatus Moduliflexus flocculans]|uniref:Glycosyl transferase group 1 n=1 Tax=Candidatus Moduliflexus flocculans TaxID=1499966 RepID=A0A0S6VQ55_9BACT|nr:glycosyl transferase group 1 [Candidatus Moduliflexus flocculans]